MSEQVQCAELTDPYEGIRDAILDLELLAHADLAEHRTGEHIIAEAPAEFGGWRYDFTHTPLDETEWADLCPTITVSKDDQYWRYRLVETDQVEYMRSGMKSPKVGSPMQTDDMLYAVHTLYDIAKTQREIFYVDFSGLPEASELHAPDTQLEQAWRLVGKIYLQVYGTEIEAAKDAPDPAATISVLLNDNGKPYTLNAQLVPYGTANGTKPPTHYEIATHKGYAAQQAGYQSDGDTMWRMQFGEHPEYERGDQADLARMVHELELLAWYVHKRPKQVFVDGEPLR